MIGEALSRLRDHYPSLTEVHIVGIGGAGMSGIARVLHGWGLPVHGSDRRASPVTAALQAEGIAVQVGHSPEHLGAADLVLASSAVPDDNPELAAARTRGVPVARRPEFLSALTAGREVIAVAGAHGKTTVTGMLALTLLWADLDPSYIVGGVMANLGTNARAGSGPHFLIEADEYRHTFLALAPSVAVVTNVEFDHPDCFRDLAHVQEAFGAFVHRIVRGGVLVACGDDGAARALAADHRAGGGRAVLYGLDPAGALAWRARDLRPNRLGGVSFTVERDGAPVSELALRIPGAFNAANALAALAVASELGVEAAVAREALEAFEGTARRFEILGEVGGVTVIDDYAHHPTQIRGVVAAARRRYAPRRIVAVWEPHTFSRVRALRADFMQAFGDADRVVVLPIYAAREPDDGSLTAEDLARQIEHPAVVLGAGSLEAAVEALAASSRRGDVVLLMGAGNETIVGQRLLAALAQGDERLV